MRIEEMTSGRLRKATSEELRDLRRRCVNLWVKYGFAKGATRSTEISRAEFLSKYAKLRLEMRARSIEPRKLVTLDGLVVEEIKKAETLADVEGCEEVVLFSEEAYDILMRKKVIGDNGDKRMFVEFAVEKKLTPKEEADFDAETEKIRENRKTKGAQSRHKFQPAKWTEKNGHPRCKVCGIEEPTSGICQGVEEWPDDWKNAIVKFQISKPETTETSRRIPVAPIGPNADIRTITINTGEGITALYDRESKRVVTYVFDREKWTMEEARKWIGEHKSAVAKAIMEKISKGGPGSGNFGHAGVPGEVGGSAPGVGGGASVTPAMENAAVSQWAMNNSGIRSAAGIHPEQIEGWSEEEKAEARDHVRAMEAMFDRGIKGDPTKQAKLAATSIARGMALDSDAREAILELKSGQEISPDRWIASYTQNVGTAELYAGVGELEEDDEYQPVVITIKGGRDPSREMDLYEQKVVQHGSEREVLLDCRERKFVVDNVAKKGQALHLVLREKRGH